jgi:predicted Zn-dependent protease with MMP-like domain
MSAPTLDDIERLARAAFERLPAAFRARCGEIMFRVEDFPDDDVMDEMDLETPFDIMGLFQGVGLTAKSESDPIPREPNIVTLYRRPLLDEWCEGEATLGEVVTHVLVHEIGHHFGFSDEDMERIEAEVDRD